MQTIRALLAALLVGVLASGAQAAPQVFWASDPVQPNDTILATGAELDTIASVQIGRLPDTAVTKPGVGALPSIAKWQDVKALQPTPQSIKIVVPANWRMGVFAYRVSAKGGPGQTRLVNAPTVWWAQGDGGETASPGGWLRVFGKSLGFGGISHAALTAKDGATTVLKAEKAIDGYSLRFALPGSLNAGQYALSVHNGFGGNAAWAKAGTVEIARPQPWPGQVYNVMDFYGADADKEAAKTLDKGSAVPDRTAAIQAAFQKAQANGGGIVYFPEGQYGIQGELKTPTHTTLRGAGMGLTTLWWGKGSMALDGGSDARHLETADASIPATLLSGGAFGLEDISLYLPRAYQTAISTGDNFHMQRVRIRVDRYWIRSGQREDGLTARLGNNCQVTDCDILAKGVAFAIGHNNLIARNKVMAGKSHISLAGSDGEIVEDNDFVSLDPTAYINLSGEGRNVYYARNRHESFFVHQSDFSWTFDGSGAAYFGKLASADGTTLTLAKDPVYPNWAGEQSSLWRRAAVCILEGRGAGQYRFVTANAGRQWTVDRPFDLAPDATSLVSIVAFRGRALVIGNRFEDAGWVNMGYGSLDVVCADNHLYRVGEFLNLGLRGEDNIYPSWFVEYLNNTVSEGHTLLQSTGDERNPQIWNGSITRASVLRGDILDADNSGRIDIGGNAADVVVEHCRLNNAHNSIDADANTQAVLFRDNTAAKGITVKYGGDGLSKALVQPASP